MAGAAIKGGQAAVKGTQALGRTVFNQTDEVLVLTDDVVESVFTNRSLTKADIEANHPGHTVTEGGGSRLETANRVDANIQQTRQGNASSNYSEQTINVKPDFYVSPSGEVLPSTGYRYDRYLNDDGTENKWVEQIMQSGQGRTTYIGFEKLDSGKEVRDRYQVKGPDKVNILDPEDVSWSDGRLRSEFDTLQLFDSNGKPLVRVPNRKGDAYNEKPEPIAESYPRYGDGGAVQLHTDGKIIKYTETVILPEE